MLSCFYVYRWVREDGTPYYIGKGKGKRAWHKNKKHNPPADISKIEIIAKNLFEHEAFILEKHLISHYGRKDLGTGILRNMTEGGDGAAGTICSRETRLKISLTKIGKKKSPETKEKMRLAKLGTIFSPEAREKMRQAQLGKKQSVETRAKRVASRAGYKHSKETIEKIKASNVGWKHTEETKRKMRLSRENKTQV